MLYPNYPGFESLSTNHLEKGTHVKSSQVEDKKKALFEVPLLDATRSLVESLPGRELPRWDGLPVLDLWGAFATGDDLVERGWQTTRQINPCRDSSLPDISSSSSSSKLRYDARELLCKETERDAPEVEIVRTVKAMPLPRPRQGQGRQDGTKKPPHLAERNDDDDDQEVTVETVTSNARVH